MITIDKIDYIMSVTGMPYEVVKVALVDADGDVEKAIDIIAHSIKPTEKKSCKFDNISFDDIKDAVKDIWKKGNATKLQVEKNGELILNLSLAVSAVGLVLAPLAAFIGAGAVFISDYDFKVVLDNGEVIDIKDYINLNKYENIVKNRENRVNPEKDEYNSEKNKENSEND